MQIESLKKAWSLYRKIGSWWHWHTRRGQNKSKSEGSGRATTEPAEIDDLEEEDSTSEILEHLLNLSNWSIEKRR